MICKVFVLAALAACAFSCPTGNCQQNVVYPSNLGGATAAYGTIEGSLPLSGYQQNIPVGSIVAPGPVQLPAPSVVSDSCACRRQVLRNRIFQQTLQVPSVRQEVRNYVNNVLQSERYSRPGTAAIGSAVSVDGLGNTGLLNGYGTGLAGVGVSTGILGDAGLIAGDLAGVGVSAGLVGDAGYGAGLAGVAVSGDLLGNAGVVASGPALVSQGSYGSQVGLPISASAPVLVSSGPGRIISDNCDCTRITSRPQLRQTVVNVPTTKTITRTFNRPRVDTVQYNTGSASGIASGLAATSAGLGYGVVGNGLAYSSLGNGLSYSSLGNGLSYSGLGNGLQSSGLGVESADLGYGSVVNGYGVNNVIGASSCN